MKRLNSIIAALLCFMLVFNPVISVYEMSLKTKDGKRVSPAYWEQKTSEIVDEYWTFENK